jgi:hypothetical protein
MVAGDERGQEVGEVVGGEDVVCGGDVRGERLQGGVGVEGSAETGEGVESLEEGGVEREAEIGEGAEVRRVVGVCGGEHAGGGGGGFGEWVVAIEHGDAEATVVELEGEREADDAGAGDADVGMVHEFSLVCFVRGYSLGVQVCVGCWADCDDSTSVTSNDSCI